jgi:hypothetical protein
MRTQSRLLQRGVDRFNACAVSWQSSPRYGHLVRRRLTVITYTGRRSGRTFTTPVAYRRIAGGVVIGVRLPDAKSWWRNFLDEGGPLTIRLDDTDRTGHATARRTPDGRVTVTVHF